MNTEDLHRRLSEAAEGEHFTVPNLLPQATARRRRRTGALAGVAALATAGVVAGGFALSGVFNPGRAAMPADTSAPTAPVTTPAETPQPSPVETPAPSPPTPQGMPTGTELLETCDRALKAAGDVFDGDVDLLDGEVFATADNGKLWATAIEVRGDVYLCTQEAGTGMGITSFTGDPSLPRADLDGTLGYDVPVSAIGEMADGSNSLSAWATLPEDAATVEFAGGHEALVEVQERGTVLLLASDVDLTQPVTFTVKAADGSVLHEGVTYDPAVD